MPLYNYSIGLAFTPTGTVAITSGDNTVSGTGTLFISEFQNGDLIRVAGQWRIVEDRISNDVLTVSADFSVTASGQAFTGVNLKNVENLSTPLMPPKSVFNPWARAIPLGSGRQRGAGRPKTEWRWGFITQAQRDMLRTFCTGKSSDVFIRTRIYDSADTYAYYSAVMLWPDEEDRDATRRLNFVISFTYLELLTVS